jgi:hypothetical protein
MIYFMLRIGETQEVKPPPADPVEDSDSTEPIPEGAAFFIFAKDNW